MIDKYSYILRGMCAGDCYCCLLPCEDRDKPVHAYTPKKIQDESSDDFVGYAKPNNEIKQEDKKSMIYLLRTLWVIGAIPVCLTCAILLIIGLFTYPIAESINYIIHGSTDTMEWEVWTMAFYIEKKYNKIKEQIEKQK